MTTDDLIAEVNSLPVEERARVADCILRSVNPPDADFDRKWAAVAQRRLSELRAAQAVGVPGAEVFARIWHRHQEIRSLRRAEPTPAVQSSTASFRSTLQP